MPARREAGRDPAEVEIVAMVATRVTDEIRSAVDELKPWLGLAYGHDRSGRTASCRIGVDLGVLEPIRRR